MSSKTLLILAASRYQLDAIITARRLGYRVVTTRQRPNEPRPRLGRHARIRLTPPTSRGSWRLHVPSVLTASCRHARMWQSRPLRRVAEALGLPGLPPESAAVVTDKARFRQWLADEGLPHPETVELGMLRRLTRPCSTAAPGC